MAAASEQNNVKVCVRFRPMNSKREKGEEAAWKPGRQSVSELQHGKETKNYTFDHIFGPSASTQNVYDEVGESLVQSTMKGINGTLFAYGQTSCGKTFTMHGNEDGTSAGLLQLATRAIFRHINGTAKREFMLRISYIEIYNEQISDLLSNDNKKLHIRLNKSGETYVDSKKKVVSCEADIYNALKLGNKKRHVGSTNMNERSSRSHTIFKIMIESYERQNRRDSTDDYDGAVLVSHLNLVDLAGSENARQTSAAGVRLREAGNINKSLLTLSRVIQQISSTNSTNAHVNFRDSKLTFILKPSLAGVNCSNFDQF